MLPAHIDDASVRIIRSAMYRPMTAVQISIASGVPVAKVFRRVRQLVAGGILREELRVADIRGREVPLYVAPFSIGYMFMEGGRLRARFSMDADAPEASGAERLL